MSNAPFLTNLSAPVAIVDLSDVSVWPVPNRETQPTQSPDISDVHVTEDVSLILINRRAAASVNNLVARALIAVATVQVNVLLMSQASAEGNFCFAVPRSTVVNVLDALFTEFHTEMERGDITSIGARSDVVLLTAFGTAEGDPLGTYLVVCRALADVGINLLVNAQGFGGRSASIIVEAAEVALVLRSLHGTRLQYVSPQNISRH